MTKSIRSSIFIGRWQPFHEGHKALIETVLKTGKPVVIAIRDTMIDHKNPYSVSERWSMIQRELHEYGELVKIIAIPDIDEVCYGRNVGYEIREIKLGDGVTKISGTKLRKKVLKEYPIIWLTGQSGAGKTTIARELKKKIGGVILDGDEMRKSISIGLGFSKDDREEHNLKVARLAKILSRDSVVIISVIAPYRSTRSKINKIIKPLWVFVDRKLPANKSKPYEKPKHFALLLNSDRQTTQEQVSKLIELLHSKFRE